MKQLTPDDDTQRGVQTSKALLKLKPDERATAIGNRFILRTFGDRLSAGEATLQPSPTGELWTVPILYWRTVEESVVVGTMIIDVAREKIVQATDKEEVLRNADTCLST